MFEELKNALMSLAIPVAEYAWDTRPESDYIAITLDGDGETLWADDKMVYQAPSGTIHLFSKSNDRSKMLLIQDTLNNFEGCSWSLYDISYEQDTQLMHWQFAFDLLEW